MKNIKRKTKPDWNKLTEEDLQKLGNCRGDRCD